MTSAEVLQTLIRLNIVLALGVLAILALRLPLRAMFGARAAYAVWLIAPVMVLASLATRPSAPAAGLLQWPAAAVAAPAKAIARLDAVPALATNATPSPIVVILALWLVGIAASAVWLGIRQRRFSRTAARGGAGPAVAGFLAPRLVLPSDFEQRFAPPERTVVLAHEEIHLRRQDARINGLLAFAQCALWFNPLLHLAAHFLRVDQELACDAVVAERHPQARGDYAQAMLKAQLAPTALPLGCYWPGGGRHPLTRRIAMLKHPAPRPARRAIAYGALALLAVGAGLAGASLQSAMASPSQSAGVVVFMPPPNPAVMPPGMAANAALVNIETRGLYIRDHKTSLQALASDLRALSSAKTGKEPVYVRANKAVVFSDFIPVLNRLRDAGFTQINIISEDI